MTTGPVIRIATNADCEGVIRLVETIYAEYDEKICLTGADQDLLDLEKWYFNPGGCFWVLELDGTMHGSHGAVPDPNESTVCRFRRLYLAKSLRGSHWGTDLMQITLDWAIDHNFRQVHFWSDVRFERAHRFFEKFHFKRDGRVREMHDGIEPYREYFYFLDL